MKLKFAFAITIALGSSALIFSTGKLCGQESTELLEAQRNWDAQVKSHDVLIRQIHRLKASDNLEVALASAKLHFEVNSFWLHPRFLEQAQNSGQSLIGFIEGRLDLSVPDWWQEILYQVYSAEFADQEEFDFSCFLPTGRVINIETAGTEVAGILIDNSPQPTDQVTLVQPSRLSLTTVDQTLELDLGDHAKRIFRSDLSAPGSVSTISIVNSFSNGKNRTFFASALQDKREFIFGCFDHQTGKLLWTRSQETPATESFLEVLEVELVYSNEMIFVFYGYTTSIGMLGIKEANGELVFAFDVTKPRAKPNQQLVIQIPRVQPKREKAIDDGEVFSAEELTSVLNDYWRIVTVVPEESLIIPNNNRQPAMRFVGFIEGRLRMIVPKWWSHLLDLAAKNSFNEFSGDAIIYNIEGFHSVRVVSEAGIGSVKLLPSNDLEIEAGGIFRRFPIPLLTENGIELSEHDQRDIALALHLAKSGDFIDFVAISGEREKILLGRFDCNKSELLRKESVFLGTRMKRPARSGPSSPRPSAAEIILTEFGGFCFYGCDSEIGILDIGTGKRIFSVVNAWSADQGHGE